MRGFDEIQRYPSQQGTPEVSLGNYDLTLVSSTRTQIVANLPPGIPAGTYLLTVERRNRSGAIDFTIGVTGPQGPGDTGHPVTGVELMAGQQYIVEYATPASSSWVSRCSTGNLYPGGDAGTSALIPGIDFSFSVLEDDSHPVAVTNMGRLGVGHDGADHCD